MSVMPHVNSSIPLVPRPFDLRPLNHANYLISTAPYRPYKVEYSAVVKNLPELEYGDSLERRAFHFGQIYSILGLIASDAVIVDAFRMGTFNPHRPRPVKVVFTDSHSRNEFIQSSRHTRFGDNLGYAYSRVYIRPSFLSADDRIDYEIKTHFRRAAPIIVSNSIAPVSVNVSDSNVMDDAVSETGLQSEEDSASLMDAEDDPDKTIAFSQDSVVEVKQIPPGTSTTADCERRTYACAASSVNMTPLARINAATAQSPRVSSPAPKLLCMGNGVSSTFQKNNSPNGKGKPRKRNKK